jgi:hypothetical protein
MYKGDYQKKLTTSAKAVEPVAHGSTKALDIISIAHPGFRDGLLKEAENMRLL